MNAVIYARYSSDRQNEQSIEGQLRECYAYAQSIGADIVHEYIDRALSGKTDDRPQFQQMIADSAQKQFEAVIVYRTDRFSRNRYDSAVYKAALKKNGVRVLSAKEPIPEGIEGILMESLLEGMAEYYSAELSQKVRRGMNESALKCQTTGSCPLGYKVGPDKKFYVDEEKAPIIRRIFEEYAKGATCAEICREMNALGLRTAKRAPFNKNSLRKLLRNKKYIGTYTYKDILIEGGMPAIIDIELFEAVQNKLSENARHPQKNRAKVDYLLSGKLFCGICSHGMTGYCGTGKSGARHYYYRCVERRAGKCEKTVVKKDWIEDLVTNETVNYVLNPEMIELIADQCASLSDLDSKENEELKVLKKQLHDTEKAIDGILFAMEQGVVTRSTKARLEELEKQQSVLEEEIRRQKKKTPILLKHQIKYLLSRYVRETKDRMEEYNRDIIDSFVHRVYLYEDRMLIFYNIAKNQTELHSLEVPLFPQTPSESNGDGGSTIGASGPPNKLKANPFPLGDGFAFIVYF